MTEQETSFDLLLAGLSRKRYQDATVDTLAKLHSDKAPQLVEALQTATPDIAEGIAKALALMPEQSAPLLNSASRSADSVLSRTAMDILVQCNTPGVDVALELVADADPTIAARGADILRDMGFQAVPILRERLKCENPSKRALAILMELDPDAVSFFEGALEDMLSTQDQILSRYAIDAAASVGDYALPILVKLIGSTNPFEQQNATNALIKIGEPIVPELIDELDNPNSITQQNAIRALKEIGLPAVPGLKDSLDSDSQLIKQNVTAVLASISASTKKGLFSRFKR